MQGVFDFYQDLPARPKRPERLFFALFPDAETSLRIDRFRQSFLRDNRVDGTPLKPERLHLSLRHVGDYRRLRTQPLYAASQAGKAVAMRSFEMTFRSVGSFDEFASIEGAPRGRPLALVGESEALSALHERLGAAMEKHGLKTAPHFAPHVTLVYGSRPIPAQAIEPIRFAVNELVLVHSELRRGRYNKVDGWPLAS
jgi:2'-5' RNA ligase